MPYFLVSNSCLSAVIHRKPGESQVMASPHPQSLCSFGDFDLAGVHIYLSEIYAHLGNRSSFLLPSDIEERLAEGNAALYNQQYARFKNMAVTDIRLQPLVNMIHHYRRGYEQEGYIR